MKISIRELRSSLKRVLNAVQLGEEVVVYVRKNPIAKITNIKPAEKAKQCNVGFGMWGTHSDIKDVDAYVRNLRAGRHDL